MIMRLTGIDDNDVRVVASAVSFWEAVKDEGGRPFTRIFFEQSFTVVRESVSEVEQLYYRAMGTAMPEMTKIGGVVVEKLEKTATADTTFAPKGSEEVVPLGHPHS